MDSVLIRGKTKPFALQTRSKRGSRFRGVSKNGGKWQVMVVRGEIKKYVGAIDNEEVAACIYDKHALMVQGFEVSKPGYSQNRNLEAILVRKLLLSRKLK